MIDGDSIREGQVLTGALFSELIRVETVAAAGAGKTVMASLLIRELELRGLAKRVSIAEQLVR